MYVGETGLDDVDLIYLAHDRKRCRVLVNVAANLRVL
jgi:hypothetical protein